MTTTPTLEQIAGCLGPMALEASGARYVGFYDVAVPLGKAEGGAPLFMCLVLTHLQKDPTGSHCCAIWWYAGTGKRACPSGAWSVNKTGPNTAVMTPVNDVARKMRELGQG